MAPPWSSIFRKYGESLGNVTSGVAVALAVGAASGVAPELMLVAAVVAVAAGLIKLSKTRTDSQDAPTDSRDEHH